MSGRGGALQALGEWMAQAIDQLNAAGTDCERPVGVAFRCMQCDPCKRNALVIDGRGWIGYEPPKVTPVGNLRDVLRETCGGSDPSDP